MHQVGLQSLHTMPCKVPPSHREKECDVGQEWRQPIYGLLGSTLRSVRVEGCARPRKIHTKPPQSVSAQNNKTSGVVSQNPCPFSKPVAYPLSSLSHWISSCNFRRQSAPDGEVAAEAEQAAADWQAVGPVQAVLVNIITAPTDLHLY
jgi:hypothetical protein